MENGWNVNASAAQEYYEMQPTDQMEHRRTSSDILARRLKNRERQRRYRARKRLEADRLRASTTNGETEAMLDAEPPETRNIFVDRVLCKRDWKKDARRAHTSKNSEQQNVESVTLLAPASMGELPTGRCEDSFALTSSESEKMKAGGRNWKAEARCQKT